MNRSTGKPAEENYEILRDGLCASKLFHKAIGDVEHYLDPKKMPGRLQWSADSHKRRYETTGSLIFCRETGNMTWDMTIMNAVRINCARMRLPGTDRLYVPDGLCACGYYEYEAGENRDNCRRCGILWFSVQQTK